MTSGNFAGSQPPEPYPVWVRVRFAARRALKWLWRSFLLLLALLACGWTLTLAVGCLKLEAALKAVTSNPALSYEVPKNWDQPAPDENAAPYFTAAYSLLSYSISPQEDALETVVKGKWKAPPKERPKDPYTWVKGWGDLTDEERLELRVWLKRQAPVFELAAQGADRPWCRYAREWWVDHGRTNREPWRIPVPELREVPRLSGALVALAHARASEGKHREAREAFRIALAVADSLRDDPFLRSQLTRTGEISLILDNVDELVPAGLAAADLEEWLMIIPRSDRFDGSLERAAKWELKKQVNLFCASPGRYWFWERLSYRWGPQTLSETLRRRLSDPLFKLSAAKTLNETAHLVEVLRKPYFEAKAEAVRLEKEWQAWHESWFPTAPLVWHLSPATRLERLQQARARCAMVRAGLEWELARVKTGAYPRTCETVDPLTGQPFRVDDGPPRLRGADIEMSNGKSEPNTWVLRRP